MKYLCSVWVPFECGIVARRVHVLVKPELRPEELRAQVVGSVGSLRALRIACGTGDMFPVALDYSSDIGEG